MALESSLDSNCELVIPAISLANGGGGFSESLSSRISLKTEENLGPILRMAQLNANLASGFMNATGVGKPSNFRSSVVHETVDSINNLNLANSSYLPSNGINSLEPYISLPPSFSSNKPMNVSSADETFSRLYQGRRRKRQQMKISTASINLSSPESQTCLESLPVGVKKEPGTPIQMLKKPRIDVNRENIPHQQTIQELLFKGLQDRDPQLKEMINQQRQQNQQHQLILPSVPQLRGVQMQVPKQQMRNMLQDLGNQVSFGPLVDSSLCSRRLMQYLYHLRNRPHDNSMVYWEKFVLEYYAPDSKKRWCFSTFSDVERQATGVFYPKPMEPWCCDICSSRSGKGLEATFEVLPRLFKKKIDSGILDEILFLDVPHAYFKVPSGLLVLEYRKAIQESIFENFRVVHEGKLHIIFRWDLKILSWEFCVQNHEEYLHRSLLSPQVDQLARAAQKYQNGIQNGASIGASSKDSHANCDRFVAARHQLARSMDLSAVNGLGYPKTFTRFLQIAEVVNCMKDLMAFSIERKMGPIESLKNYVQSCKTMDQLKEEQGMEMFAGPQNQPIGHEHRYVQSCKTMYQLKEEQGMEMFAGPQNQPIGHEHHYVQSCKTMDQLKEKQGMEMFAGPQNQPIGHEHHANEYGCRMTDNELVSGSAKSTLDLADFNHQLLRRNAYIACMRRGGQDSYFANPSIRSTCYDSQPAIPRLHTDLPPCNLPRSPSGPGRNYHQHLIDKILQEMVAANRGQSLQYAHEKINNEAAHQSRPPDRSVRNNMLHSTERSNAASGQMNLANASRIETVPHGTIVKTKPRSPVQLP